MTQDKDSTRKLVDEIPEAERRKPPKPPGRVEVVDPDENIESRLELERELLGIGNNDEAIMFLANSLSEEQWKEIRDILRQFPITGDDTYIEKRVIPATAIYIGKLQVRKQYSRKMQGNYDAIMADAQAEIDALTKEDFLGWLERAKEHDIKPKTEEARKLYGEGLLGDDIETAVDWLSERCRPFEYALEEWGQDTKGLERLIYEHASTWFTVPIPEEVKRRYRQAKDAQGIVEKTDGRTPLITHPDYSGALNLGEHGNAYLQEYDPSQLPIEDRNKLNIDSVEGFNFQFENGNLFISVPGKDGNRRKIMSAQLQNMKTGKHIQDIDTGLLKVVFGFIVHAKRQDPGTERVWIRTPDLYYELYRSRNVPATSYAHDEDGNILLDEDGNKIVTVKGFKDRIIEKVQIEYQNIGGMIFEGGREPSIYPPLLFEGYNEAEDKIGFSSPYMDSLYEQMGRHSLKYQSTNDSGRTAELDKPALSYMIDSTLYTEKNKPAIRNVEIIVDTIERAGVGVRDVHLSIKTILERNALLREKLEESRQKTQTLQRAFKRTFELLRTHTHLQDKYKELELPEHPQDTPTAKDYKTKVLHFRHSGLNRDYKEE